VTPLGRGILGKQVQTHHHPHAHCRKSCAVELGELMLADLRDLKTKYTTLNLVQKAER